MQASHCFTSVIVPPPHNCLHPSICGTFTRHSLAIPDASLRCITMVSLFLLQVPRQSKRTSSWHLPASRVPPLDRGCAVRPIDELPHPGKVTDVFIYYSWCAKWLRPRCVHPIANAFLLHVILMRSCDSNKTLFAVMDAESSKLHARQEHGGDVSNYVLSCPQQDTDPV